MRAACRFGFILSKRAAPLMVAGIGLQLHRGINPDAYVAKSFFTSKPPSPPPPTAHTVPVGPYGKTSFTMLGDEEMQALTKIAVQLYYVSLSGHKGVEEFAVTIWPTWSEFTKEVRKDSSEAEVNAKVQEYAKKFNAKLPKDGHQTLQTILAILEVKSVDEIFAESARKIRDPNTKTVLDGLPRSLRVFTRLRELRQWNEQLSGPLDQQVDRNKYPRQIEAIPKKHAELYVEQLRKQVPNLNDDVAKLMGDIAEFRIKLGLLQPYLSSSREEVSKVVIDKKYEWFSSAAEWANEHTEKKSTQKFDAFVKEKVEKKYPGVTHQEQQEILAMAKEFKQL